MTKFYSKNYNNRGWCNDIFKSGIFAGRFCDGFVRVVDDERSNFSSLPRPRLHSGSIYIRYKLYVYRLSRRASPDGRTTGHGLGFFCAIINGAEMEERQNCNRRAIARNVASINRWRSTNRYSHFNVWPCNAFPVLATAFRFPPRPRTQKILSVIYSFI